MSELLIPGHLASGDDEHVFGRRFFVEQFHEGEAPSESLVERGGIPVVRLQLINGDSLDIFCFERFGKDYLVAQVFVDPGDCDDFYQTFLPYGAILRVNLHRYRSPERKFGFKITKPEVDHDD
jgi:hypothetical protein